MTDGERLHFYMHDELIADVPAESLVLGGGAPVYTREYTEPSYIKKNRSFNMDTVTEPDDLTVVARHLASHPNIASKHWVTRQYDSMVGTINMTTNRPCDAAVVEVRGTDKALALTVDCNSRYVYADPKTGCSIAVAEAARNLSCSGAEPSAVTNCLNFGNPYNPEVYWQFVNSIKGMGEACTRFNTPVTGGNVSFYNQSVINGVEVPVFPSPVIGMIGLLSKDHLMTLNFKNEGDSIFLLGKSVDDIASSEYLYSFLRIKNAPAPYFNLEEEFRIQEVVRQLIKAKLVESAHDVSDGGLFIALMESALAGNLGFSIDSDSDLRKDAFLFGEAQGRITVTVAPQKLDAFIEALALSDIDFTNLGHVTGNELMIDGISFGDIDTYRNLYNNAVGNAVSNDEK